MRASIRWIVGIVVIFTALQLVGCVQGPVASKKTAPSKLEPIEGSDFKRVLLTEKAAERIDVQTVAVRAEPATRVRRVGGQVVALPSEPSTTTAEPGQLRVRVNLSENELSQVDRSRPARVLALDDDEEDSEEAGLEAEPDDDFNGMDDAEETEGPAGSMPLYYSMANSLSGDTLTEGQPVFVKLTLTGAGTERKLVPFAALIYGVHGETWVYTNPEPLAFVRAPVTVDYIEDGQAFLSEGPPVGTEVVTVGGSLLYGAETGVSK